MDILTSNKELNNKELYFLTKNQSIRRMSEIADSDPIEVVNWVIYVDEDQNKEIFAVQTNDAVYATNSQSVISSFRDILEVFEKEEIHQIEINSGVSKNNRTFYTCSYVG